MTWTTALRARAERAHTASSAGRAAAVYPAIRSGQYRRTRAGWRDCRRRPGGVRAAAGTDAAAAAAAAAATAAMDKAKELGSAATSFVADAADEYGIDASWERLAGIATEVYAHAIAAAQDALPAIHGDVPRPSLPAMPAALEGLLRDGLGRGGVPMPSAEEMMASIRSLIESLPDALPAMDAPWESSTLDMRALFEEVSQKLPGSRAAILESFSSFSDQLKSGDVSAIIAASVAFVSIVLVSSVNADTNKDKTQRRGVRTGTGRSTAAKQRTEAVDRLPFTYDSDAIARYYSRRPLQVASRLLAILRESASVLMMINARDRRKKADPAYASSARAEEEDRRIAKQLVEVLTTLGPTFIKAGQAASIRSDILSEVYAAALRELQDKLPAFDSSEARSLICAELGLASVANVFESIDPEPVAAASLGQVYRAKMYHASPDAQAGGDGPKSLIDVAVKVQRPGVRETICLDLFILRAVAPYYKKRLNLNTDLAAVVDEWGNRFLAELDYRKEAESATSFNAAMKDLRLDDGVFAPEVIESATSGRVLTTRWIDGKRLDEIEVATDADAARAEKDEVLRLCQLALNTYLVMLCETGQLHADPHPGNLLRDDTDGRLCILDWGLVTEVRKDKQVALIQYIAHLTNEQWEEVPADLVTLGFVPESKAKIVLEESDVCQVLGQSLKAITSGGGAGKVRSKLLALSTELKTTQTRYGNLFQIPPYFAYILRTFNILEGISLSVDGDYSITKECYPYLARRLLTDTDPRIQGALNSLIYVDVNGSRQLNVRRFRKLTGAFKSFGDTAAGYEGDLPSPEYAYAFESGSASARAGGVSAGSREILDLLLSREGNYVQSLVVDEVARAIDVTSRSGLHALISSIPGVGETNSRLAASVLASTSDAVRRVLPQAALDAIEDTTVVGGETGAAAPPGLNARTLTAAPFAAAEYLRMSLLNDMDNDDRESLKTYRAIQDMVTGSSGGTEETPVNGKESDAYLGGGSPATQLVNAVSSLQVDDIVAYAPSVASTAWKVGNAVTRRVFERTLHAQSDDGDDGAQRSGDDI